MGAGPYRDDTRDGGRYPLICAPAGVAGYKAGGDSTAAEMEISSPRESARQPLAKVSCLPTPEQTDEAAAAISKFVRRSRRTKLAKTQQAAAAAMRGSSSPNAPETPAAGAKRSASEAFGVCAERRPDGKILKACGSSADEAPLSSLRRKYPACADPPQRIETAAMKAASQRHHRAPEAANVALETDLIHGNAPSLAFSSSSEKVFQQSI